MKMLCSSIGGGVKLIRPLIPMFRKQFPVVRYSGRNKAESGHILQSNSIGVFHSSSFCWVTAGYQACARCMGCSGAFMKFRCPFFILFCFFCLRPSLNLKTLPVAPSWLEFSESSKQHVSLRS